MNKTKKSSNQNPDVVLIGAGIMSATLGVLLKELQPDLTIEIFERLDVAAAESSETQALANYSHARIAFDQALGTTLGENHISIDEAMSGHVARRSGLPANLPTEGRQ